MVLRTAMLLAGCATSAPAAATPVLVELFTSEGCSSCPPADAVLARLAATQPVAGAEVVVLSEHVDYWNSLGWRDPFSAAQFSERQQAYARTFGLDGPYTPQMVIDGGAQLVGSNQPDAIDAIAVAARAAKGRVTLAIEPADVTGSSVRRLRIRVDELPTTPADDVAEVLLAITEGALRSSVARGENGGRELQHTGVVRALRVVGRADADGFTGTVDVPLAADWAREQVRAVVFVQERRGRRVLAVGAVGLAAQMTAAPPPAPR